jgi:hypothetical protein
VQKLLRRSRIRRNLIGYRSSVGFASSGTLKGAIIGGIAGAGGSMINGDHSASGRVICTHFYRKSRFDAELWRADMEFTYRYLSQKTIRGYQYWAIPYVRLMRRSKVAESLIFPLALWRAEELAYRMGRRAKGNWKGKLVRLIGEPTCYLIGNFVGEQNWQKLWTEESARA